MSTIRTTISSVVVTLVLAVAVYFAFAPQAVQAAASCPGPSAASISTQDLKAILNGRYVHRVGLPR